ncbi:MAG: hypothetical protein U1E86_28620 [Burkholderiaceae bacterium]
MKMTGGRPAHDLLDGGRRDVLEVVLPHARLVTVLLERDHAVADRGARGLVAGDREQDEERRRSPRR